MKTKLMYFRQAEFKPYLYIYSLLILNSEISVFVVSLDLYLGREGGKMN